MSTRALALTLARLSKGLSALALVALVAYYQEKVQQYSTVMCDLSICCIRACLAIPT